MIRLKLIITLLITVALGAMAGSLYSLAPETVAQSENGLQEQIERRLEEKERRRRQKEEERRKAEEVQKTKEAEKARQAEEEKRQEDNKAENGFGDFEDFGDDDEALSDYQETPRGLFFSGLFRNDAYFADPPDLHPKTDLLFHDILEMRLISEATSDKWRFYSDARFFHYSGEIAQLLQVDYEVKLLRAFIRYSSDVHEFSVGKTYINFGNAGLFNPFELDKSVQMTDLQYARNGHLAAEYLLHWQDTSSLKIFGAAPETAVGAPFSYDFLWGVSPGVHIGSFNLGGVLLHKKSDFNTAGLYFKGDLFIGVEGAAAAHLDDEGKLLYTEANFGIDYSFTEESFVSLMFYYNEIGADDPANYLPSPDQFLLARYYLFAAINYSVDEFLGFQWGTFYNIIDNSFVLLPSMNVVIANGLSATFQIIIPTGEQNTEFSKNTLGEWTALLRMESKF